MTDVALFLQPIESSFSTKAYEKVPIMHETVILLDNSWTRETQMMHEFSQNKNVKFGTISDYHHCLQYIVKDKVKNVH